MNKKVWTVNKMVQTVHKNIWTVNKEVWTKKMHSLDKNGLVICNKGNL